MTDSADALDIRIVALEKALGTRLYRSVLREYGKVEHPNLIKDAQGKQKVLQVLESAVRGVHRLNAVKKRLDPKMLESLLTKVQAPSLAEIGDMKTLRDVVLGLEQLADSTCSGLVRSLERQTDHSQTVIILSEMNSTHPIRHISDTALWVAVYRAKESERADAVFRDPYASKLAGERGLQMAAAMPFAERHAWSYVARTWLVDQVIERELLRSTDMVINLAAGLDARPYRMRLPASLRWVEVDLPEMLNYKQEVLATGTPHCRVERVAVDLRDSAGRRALFQRLANEAKRVVVLSEGLLVYFSDQDVSELARDLAVQPTFRIWATDLTSPALLKMLQKAIGGPLDRAGSPLKFAPREGPNFFTAYGWKSAETRSILHTAAKLKRLSFGMRLLSLLPDPGGRKPDKPWGGVCVFENSTSA